MEVLGGGCAEKASDSIEVKSEAGCVEVQGCDVKKASDSIEVKSEAGDIK